MAYAIKEISRRNNFNKRAEAHKEEVKSLAAYLADLIEQDLEMDPEQETILYTIPIEYLSIAEYQREPNEAKINSIKNKFDPKKIGAVTISIRDGKFFIVDGVHRCAAMDDLGKKEIPASIFAGCTIEGESKIFSGQDNDKTRVNNITKFNADVIAKVTDAIAIKKICDDRKLTIKFIASAKKNTSINKNNINAIKTLRTAYKINGDEAVKLILDLIIESGWSKFDCGFKSDCLMIGKTLVDIGYNNGVHAVRGDENYNTILRSMKMFSDKGPDGWLGVAHTSFPGNSGQHGEGSIVKYVKALCGVID